MEDTRKMHRSNSDDGVEAPKANEGEGVRMVAVPDEESKPRDLELSDTLRFPDAVALLLKRNHDQSKALERTEGELAAERAERARQAAEIAQLRAQLPEPKKPEEKKPREPMDEVTKIVLIALVAPLLCGLIGVIGESAWASKQVSGPVVNRVNVAPPAAHKPVSVPRPPEQLMLKDVQKLLGSAPKIQQRTPTTDSGKAEK